MTEIFLIVDEHGEYSNYSKTNIAAYQKREEAEAEVVRLEALVAGRRHYNELLGEFTRTEGGIFALREPAPLYGDRWVQWSVKRDVAAAVYMREQCPELAAQQENPAEFFDNDHEYSVEEMELR